MIVLDASAAFDFLTPKDPEGLWVTEWILKPGQRIHAPHLIDVEVAAATRKRVGAGELGARAGKSVIRDLQQMSMARYPHTPFLERIWELRGNLTSHDAVYVALAEVLGATLVTTDRRLARTRGHRATIEVFPD